MQPLVDYAQPVPWYRRQRPQAVIVALSVVAAVILSCVWLVRIAPQLRFLYEQRQWMEFTAPADTVIFARCGSATAAQHVWLANFRGTWRKLAVCIPLSAGWLMPDDSVKLQTRGGTTPK
jgi:hypothetical protein